MQICFQENRLKPKRMAWRTEAKLLLESTPSDHGGRGEPESGNQVPGCHCHCPQKERNKPLSSFMAQTLPCHWPLGVSFPAAPPTSNGFISFPERPGNQSLRASGPHWKGIKHFYRFKQPTWHVLFPRQRFITQAPPGSEPTMEGNSVCGWDICGLSASHHCALVPALHWHAVWLQAIYLSPWSLSSYIFPAGR